MKSNNPKKILFADAKAATMGFKPGADGTVEKPDYFLFGAGDGDSVRLADELARRVYAWAERGDIESTQLTLFLKRVKQSPSVTDVKLDGNVLVLSIADGTVVRITPDDGLELPEIPVVGHLAWYERAWYWIKAHKAVAIGGTTLLLALVILLIVKRH